MRRRPSTIWVAALVFVGVAAVAAAVNLLGPRSPTSGAAGPAALFVDATAGSGVAFTYGGDVDFQVGGGVAVLDCDEDGRPDLYLAGGANAAGLWHDDSSDDGAIRFSQRIDPATDLTGANGAYPIDVDGDGHVDLAVLRNGGNVLLRGLGGCRFELANEPWHLDGGTARTNAFSATWESGSSWPTLAFGNYQDPTSKDFETWCVPNVLVRPAPGDGGGFAAPIALAPSWCALSMLFSDWDGSGRRDLRVSNDVHFYPIDVGNEQLWRIEPGAAPRLYTAADGWGTVHIQGMGIGSYDLTGDGLPEVYLTSQGANRLQTLTAGASRPTYGDIGAVRDSETTYPIAGDTNLPSTAWHPEFADVNNDGFIDLFVSKGNVAEQPDYARKDPSSLMLGQADGTFQDATQAAGLVDFGRGRGAALVDLNFDGRLDLVESFYGAPVKIWRNEGPEGSVGGGLDEPHWLAVRAEQPGPNVDAIGGWIEVQAGGVTYRRELTIGGGHAGGQLGWTHFGLGVVSGAQVRVRWPDGEVGGWQQVDSDGFVIVDRATGSVERWAPPGP